MIHIFSKFFGDKASRIDGDLWQGGYPKSLIAVREAGFDMIVLAAHELQPGSMAVPHRFPDGITAVCAPMHDVANGPTPDEVRRAVRAANQVVAALRSGRKVLSTCAAGRNRSGLVTALALVAYHKISGTEAANRVRAARPLALTNEGFSAFLDRVPSPRTKEGRKFMTIL